MGPSPGRRPVDAEHQRNGSQPSTKLPERTVRSTKENSWMPATTTKDSLNSTRKKKVTTVMLSGIKSLNTATRTTPIPSPGRRPLDAEHQRNGSQPSRKSPERTVKLTKENSWMPATPTARKDSPKRKKRKKVATAREWPEPSGSTATPTVTSTSPGKKPVNAVHQLPGSQSSTRLPERMVSSPGKSSWVPAESTDSLRKRSKVDTAPRSGVLSLTTATRTTLIPSPGKRPEDAELQRSSSQPSSTLPVKTVRSTRENSWLPARSTCEHHNNPSKSL